MVGIDIVDVARFERVLARRGERMTQRLFTACEIAYCKTKRRPGPHLAARFAAKECVIKALGGRGAWHYALIEVTRGPLGKPGIQLHGSLGELARGIRFDVSMTHDGNVAAAVVTAVRKGRDA